MAPKVAIKKSRKISPICWPGGYKKTPGATRQPGVISLGRSGRDGCGELHRQRISRKAYRADCAGRKGKRVKKLSREIALVTLLFGAGFADQNDLFELTAAFGDDEVGGDFVAGSQGGDLFWFGNHVLHGHGRHETRDISMFHGD